MIVPTTLYRYYDKDGNLLYVGITDSLSRRAAQHNKNAQWHSYAAYATFEHYVSREDALEAESKAIINESPSYNIAGSDQFAIDPIGHWYELISKSLQDPVHADVLQYIIDAIDCSKVEELSSDKIKWFFLTCLSDMYDNRIPCVACRTLANSKEFVDASERIWQLIEGDN